MNKHLLFFLILALYSCCDAKRYGLLLSKDISQSRQNNVFVKELTFSKKYAVIGEDTVFFQSAWVEKEYEYAESCMSYNIYKSNQLVLKSQEAITGDMNNKCDIASPNDGYFGLYGKDLYRLSNYTNNDTTKIFFFSGKGLQSMNTKLAVDSLYLFY